MSTVSCSLCNKVFTYRKNLYQHQRNIHKIQPSLIDYPKNFTCDECGISFTFFHNLQRHKKNVHNVSVHIFEKHECSYCNETFRTQHSYLRHLALAHNEDSRTLTFGSKREFEVWKSEEEEKAQSIFSTRSCYKVFKNARRTNFLCHRYGEFKSKNTGRRCLRMQGSTREGNHCTARMEVTEFQNGEVRVIYFPRHKMHGDSGHYKARKELSEMEINKNRSSILEKVSTNRKGRIRLADIRYVHKLSQNLNSSHILKVDKTKNSSKFIIKSESDTVKTYTVSLTGNPCYPGKPLRKCNLVCTPCNVCIHEYKCSCNNWSQYGGLMCKHIHLVASSLKNSSVDRFSNEGDLTDLWKLDSTYIDDSIFVEIEVDEDGVIGDNVDLPLLNSSSFGLPQDEVDLSVFEGILNLGRNAALSQLSPCTIQKINSSAHEYLSLLESLLDSEH